MTLRVRKERVAVRMERRRRGTRRKLTGQHEGEEDEGEGREVRRAMVRGSYDLDELEETMMNRWYSD